MTLAVLFFHLFSLIGSLLIPFYPGRYMRRIMIINVITYLVFIDDLFELCQPANQHGDTLCR